jgi:hypothetical protein
MSKEQAITDSQKLDFIIKTEMRILEAIFKGHKCSDSDEFAEDRKIIKQYRIELGLIK